MSYDTILTAFSNVESDHFINHQTYFIWDSFVDGSLHRELYDIKYIIGGVIYVKELQNGEEYTWKQIRVEINQPITFVSLVSFTELPKYWLPLQYQVQIWQVSPQQI